MTFGELECKLKLQVKGFSYKTYASRLNNLSKSPTPGKKEDNKESSRYVIQPVLNRREKTRRGGKVYYSLTKDAKIRYCLQLPILKSESTTEQAYRLLFYYIVFYYNPIIKLKDEDKYISLLKKLHINKNELQFVAKADFKEFKITKWTHPISEIEFTRKDFLKPSGKIAAYEYYYMLPGISPVEFQKIKEFGIPYQQLNFTKDELIRYFELLENQNLIKKIKSLQLVHLNEERYTIVDDSLKMLLQDCWPLKSHVLTYLEYVWKSICKPTNEERIWFEHFWGKSKSNQWFIECNNIRREYQKKNENTILKETRERIDWEKSEIKEKFDRIKKEHIKTIKDYYYFINPLLNTVYPEFLRKKFNQ